MLTAALVFSVLLSFVALAVDTGHLYWIKSKMQTAADAAAIAAALELSSGDAGMLEAARADAALNGFTDGLNGASVTTHHPPESGAFRGNPAAVEALVAQRVGTFFLGFAGLSSIPVSARAVGSPGSGGNCIYALDPSAAGALTLAGDLKANCGVAVSSTSPKALLASDGACLSSPSLAIAGGYSDHSRCSLAPHAPPGPPEKDPLQYLNPPAYPPGHCDYVEWSGAGGLDPGVYCGGIALTGNAEFHPGIYVLLGGGLTARPGFTVEGHGVTFYNTAGPGHPYRPVTLDSASSLLLTAPEEGSLAGILFFEDRAMQSSQPNRIVLAGTGAGTEKIQGALYFPSTELVFSGGSPGQASYTILVARRITVAGPTSIANDFSGHPKGSPVKAGSLLAE